MDPGFDDFNIDKQEYQSVFKVFDKNNTGEISIAQVYELINKFDQAQKTTNAGEQAMGTGTKAGGGGGMGKNPDGSSPNVIGAGGLRQQNTGGGASFGQKATMGARAGVLGGVTAPSGNKNTNISPTTKKAGGTGAAAASGSSGFGPGGQGLQLKPTAIDPSSQEQKPGIMVQKQSTLQQQPSSLQQQQTLITSHQQKEGGLTTQQTNYLSEEVNFGNVPLAPIPEDKKGAELTFPNGKSSLKFEDFFDIVKQSCADKEQAENYLIHAFSMFDRKKKGYINNEDLKEVFRLLGETVTDDEVNTMIKIAGVKSNDKINFKEFVDFFNKVE